MLAYIIRGGSVAEVVFSMRGISRVYRMGDVEVHALRSVDLELYPEFAVLLGPFVEPIAGRQR